MSLKPGAQVKCWLEPNGERLWQNRGPVGEEKNFELISIHLPYAAADFKVAMIAVPSNFMGWMIGKWHIEYLKIDPKYLNCRFYELPEWYLNRSKDELGLEEPAEEAKKESVEKIEMISEQSLPEPEIEAPRSSKKPKSSKNPVILEKEQVV